MIKKSSNILHLLFYRNKTDKRLCNTSKKNRKLFNLLKSNFITSHNNGAHTHNVP